MAFQSLVRRIPQLYSSNIFVTKTCCTPLCRNKTEQLLNDSVKRFCSSNAIVEKDNDIINKKGVFDKLKEGLEHDKANQKVFAVVHIAAQQFKVSINDIVMIQKKIEADCGDKIRLEKVLAAGCRNSTFIGMPLLKRELVNVQAMVVEKTKGEKKIAFKKKKRKDYKRWKGHRQDMSILKITSIDIDAQNI